MRTRVLGRGSMVTVLALLALVLGAAPGLAHHKDRHDGGPKKDRGVSGPTVTEDNDDNDGGTPNNVADEGDNAHPSGKDRSEEKGNSGNQGNSPSDPDGDSNGGPDKPGGSGGVDLADQDGNNGCGNDDDFEDDNNGNCGGLKDEETAAKSICAGDMSEGQSKECDSTVQEDETVCADDATMTDENECEAAISSAPSSGEGQTFFGAGFGTGAEVLGEVITNFGAPAPSDGTTPAVAGEAAVAGEMKVAGDSVFAAGASSPAERPATMPFTGMDVLTFLAAGLGLLLTGLLVSRLRTN